MSASAPLVTGNDAPPPYEATIGTYPSEPPPKYEPPKYEQPTCSEISTNHTVYQPNNGYHAMLSGPPILVNIPENRWGPDSQIVYCPYCKAHISTIISHESGALTWLSSGLLCLFGCWLCCPLPFCIGELLDVRHRCRLCFETLGVYRRFD